MNIFRRKAKPPVIFFTDDGSRYERHDYTKDPDASAMSPSFASHGSNASDESDLTLRQIRNALEQSNQLTESNMYFGNPRENASYFAKRIEGLDAANDTPGTTTGGGTATSGMRQTLVAQFPLETYAFWPETTPEGQYISRRDMQSKSDPERIAGPFTCGPGEFLWSEINTDTYRLWKATNQALEMGAYNVNAKGAGQDDAHGVSSDLWETGGSQNAKPTPQRGPDEEISGVGAESWVGKKSNSTGYRITTADSVRPGIAQGRTASRLVARRVAGLESINRANKAMWARG